jgi:hypothetical protein
MKVTAFITLCVVALHAKQTLSEAQNSTANDSEEAVTDVEESGGMFEGDIQGYVPPKQGSKHRGAMIDKRLRWPKGVVPYQISNQFSATHVRVIEAAFADISAQTCITFVKRTGSAYYIDIVSNTGCNSQLGRVKGRRFRSSQPVSLQILASNGGTCVHKGVIEHELMHALGFVHEQSRPDRDQYVTIKWDNINNYPRSMTHNFNKYASVTTQGTKYDYGSLMHYKSGAFSKSGTQTILAKNGAAIGQRNGLSATDVKEINMLYHCDGKVGKGNGGGGGGNAGCKDSNKNCGSWADRGECEANPRYMLSNCKKSCDQC